MAKYDLAYKKATDIDTLAASSVVNADFVLIADTSAGTSKKVAASNVGIQTGDDQQVVYNAQVTATLAEINAGKTLIAAESGVTLRPLSYLATVSGTFTTGTTVDIEDDNGTPVVVGALSQAQLADAAKLRDGDTGASRGAGLGGDLTADAGLVVTKTGSDFEGGTSITFDIQYTKTVS